MKIKKINLAIDEQLHRALKLKATTEGKHLYVLVIEILTKEVYNNDQ